MPNDEQNKIRRMLQEFEHKVIGINKETIREIAGEIGADDFTAVGRTIAQARANYLKEVIKLSKADNDSVNAGINESLVEARKNYDEAMAGFAALKLALERGYFVLKDS